MNYSYELGNGVYLRSVKIKEVFRAIDKALDDTLEKEQKTTQAIEIIIEEYQNRLRTKVINIKEVE